MELAASEEAIARAEVDRGSIDLLLTNTSVPEYLLSSTACLLHHRLGLHRRCFTLQVDAVSNSFQMQLALAERMIAAGRARCALLVQSCSVLRLVDPKAPIAPLFGDAAT